MSLITIMPAFEMSPSDRTSEKANVISDSESFAKALEVFGSSDQQDQSEEGLGPSDIISDTELPEAEQDTVTPDKKAIALALGLRSELEQAEKQTIESDLPNKMANTPIPGISQQFSGILSLQETAPSVSDETNGASLMEERVSEKPEASLEGKFLTSSEFHIGKSSEGRGLPSALPEPNSVNVLSVNSAKNLSPKDLSQREGGRAISLHQVTASSGSAEVSTLKISTPKKTEPLEAGENKLEALQAEKVGTADDTSLAKSSSKAEMIAPGAVLSSLIDDQDGDGVVESLESDSGGKHLRSQQGISTGLSDPMGMDASLVHSGKKLKQGKSTGSPSIDPLSESSNPPKTLAEKQMEVTKMKTSNEYSKVEAGTTVHLKTEGLKPDAIKISLNENQEMTHSEKMNQASEERLVKSRPEIKSNDVVQESLSAKSRSVEFQEDQDRPVGVQSRSILIDGLPKVSSLAQTPNLEIESPEPALGRPALSASEKTAVLSQLTEQIRVLEPGKVEQLRLSLHPESLGALHVELSLQKGAVLAHITTGDHLVKELLEGNQALLRQSLAEQGFEVDGFSVDVGDAEGGFKDRASERSFIAKHRFNLQNNAVPSEKVRPEFSAGGQGRISLYV